MFHYISLKSWIRLIQVYFSMTSESEAQSPKLIVSIIIILWLHGFVVEDHIIVIVRLWPRVVYICERWV